MLQESDPGTEHLTDASSSLSVGDRWLGQTRCGLIGELEYLTAAARLRRVPDDFCEVCAADLTVPPA